ncbi:hypothetical protein E2C01_044057 [Portunus trituberculatus]|uniref:Uncharacterized protein n=1 Tax=Portunus trituberculatus TaxID=210409 RepID=A0A5B7FYX6_PORTR|nr:hypothetical protein [Portunus trituberculatus]
MIRSTSLSARETKDRRPDIPRGQATPPPPNHVLQAQNHPSRRGMWRPRYQLASLRQKSWLAATSVACKLLSNSCLSTTVYPV